MKKLLALIVCLATVIAVFPLASFAAKYDDVQETDWHAKYVDFCVVNGYMSGTAAYKFDPNIPLTRAMFPLILAKIAGADLTEYNGDTPFGDVAPGQWYSAGIQWAYENGLTAGIGNNIYGLNFPLTRAQFATFIMKFAEFTENDTSERADLSDYKDANDIPTWSRNAAEWCVAKGIINSVSTSGKYFAPNDSCTRAQASTMLYRVVLEILTDCEHEWAEATCTEGEHCTKCNIKRTSELGHEFADGHMCTETDTCTRCGETIEGKDHVMKEATCTETAKCRFCNYTEGAALGHNFVGTSCTTDGKCTRCGEVKKALGHTTSNGVCDRCGLGIFPKPHDQAYYYIKNRGNGGEITDSYYDPEYNISYAIAIKAEQYSPVISATFTEYDNDYDIRITTKVTFGSVDAESYSFVTEVYSGSYLYARIRGGFKPQNIDGRGYFVLYGYEGDSEVKNEMLSIANLELAVTLLNTNDILYQYTGVTLYQYRIDMSKF